MSRINDPASGSSATEQLHNKAAEVSQSIRDVGSHVRDAASDKYNELRDQASGYINQGKERAQEWEQSIESYVQEKPLQAVLIAAGVGLLLGLLWKRS